MDFQITGRGEANHSGVFFENGTAEIIERSVILEKEYRRERFHQHSHVNITSGLND